MTDSPMDEQAVIEWISPKSTPAKVVDCCTRLGYTFDYAGINNPKKQSYIGVPEVIIRKGTSVKVIEKIPIEDFHKKEIYNKYFGKK